MRPQESDTTEPSWIYEHAIKLHGAEIKRLRALLARALPLLEEHTICSEYLTCLVCGEDYLNRHAKDCAIGTLIAEIRALGIEEDGDEH